MRTINKIIMIIVFVIVPTYSSYASSFSSISKQDTRPATQPVYLASPGYGPASLLQGKIVVAHIFWQDKESNPWNKSEQQVLLNAWSIASNWLKTRLSSDYKAGISFVNEVITVKESYIAKNVVNNKRPKDAFRNIVALSRHLGHKTPEKISQKLKTKHKANAVALMIYLNKNGRSIAHRCMKECSLVGEYVYINRKPENSNINDHVYAQIHEFLHLFGADDLYKVKGAEDYFRNDIMHHPPANLDKAAISPITAYAMGLLGDKPKTPFPVEMKWNKEINAKYK